MLIRPKNIVIPVLILFFTWFGWSTYNYFFDTTIPELNISGLDNDGYYAGDSQCIIQGSDGYKVSDISVWLDGRLIVNKFKVSRKQFEHPLSLPTKSLPNGKHNLKIEIVDGSFNKNKTFKELSFYVDNTPLQAAFVRPNSDYKVFQGRTLHIQFQVNKDIKEAKINLLSKTFDCCPESKGSLVYECFVPISSEEQPNEYPFSIKIFDYTNGGIKLDGKFQVMPYPFKEEVLVFNSQKIKEEEELGLKQQALEDELESLIKKSPKEKLWHGQFYIPMKMSRLSCDYGTKRITQQKGYYAHKAVDITGMPRTVVWAPQDGIVVIKNRFVQSGNTVVIDHGCGIFTMLYHLEQFSNVNVGERIKRGNPVGTMGKTGYATGYHLHWEMRINNVPIDPIQWTRGDF